MHPVQRFKANFTQDEAVDAASDNSGVYSINRTELHGADSSVRNLCLVWEDGRRAFFNYAYLVAGDLIIQDNINVLLLSFGSYTVLLKGYNLGPLFDALLGHSPKNIAAINPRYLTQHVVQHGTVVEIIVKSE